MDGVTIQQIATSDQGVAGCLEGIQESLHTKTYRPQALQCVEHSERERKVHRYSQRPQGVYKWQPC